MLNIFKLDSLRGALEKARIWIAVVVMASIGLTPILLQGSADAAQLTNRSVTISSSQPSETGVTYRFDFDIPTDTAVQSMIFEFCDTALGACTKPAGLDVNYTLTSLNASQTFDQDDFAEFTGADAGDCDDHNNGTPADSTEYCVTRTDGDDELAINAKSIAIDDVTNATIPSGNNTPIYVRIHLYSDTAFATEVHEGIVVASIVEQLTVTGRVQERLVFCVYALDDTAGSAAAGSGSGAMPDSCSANEANAGTEVDIGVIDNSSIAVSPVDNNPPTSLGNDTFGAAQVSTNASNGVVITYYATEASTGTEELRAFRVPGATCVNGGTDTQDQCFISADESTGETFSAGTERFGIHIACIANSTTTGGGLGTTDNLGSGGSGSGTGGTWNAVYEADGDMDDPSDNCESTAVDSSVDFAWNDTSTAQALVSSDNVVDDEIVKMRFGATAAATTPTGTYTAAATMIATATF